MLDEGKRSEALSLWKDLCAMTPERWEPFFNAGLCWYQMGLIDEARNIQLRGPPSSFQQACVLHNLTCCEIVQKNYEKAGAYARKAIQLDPSYEKILRADPELQPIWGLLR